MKCEIVVEMLNIRPDGHVVPYPDVTTSTGAAVVCRTHNIKLEPAYPTTVPDQCFVGQLESAIERLTERIEKLEK